MYKVCIYNGENDTIIHHPTTEEGTPHLGELQLKEGLSLVDSLSFPMKMNNPGYDLINEIITKIKVIDVRDDTVRFTGRILDAPKKMDSDGKMYRSIVCEGALSYLNDTNTRDETFTGNVIEFITWILDVHNSKVEDSKKIQVGNITPTTSITYDCNFKNTLATILEVREKNSIDGDIRVREENGLLYLDWLLDFSDNTIDVVLGVNMKDIIKDKDVTSFGTRIIPLGANNLTINDVNGGLDYIDDIDAKNIYGTIEKFVTYSDIIEPQELMDRCVTDISNYTQPKFLLEASALDLSFISGNKVEQFMTGAKLHIYNPVMNVDDLYKIVSMDLDLLKPYDPKLTIANAPVTLSSNVNDLRKETITNNSVIKGVQVGDDFGIRMVREDGKVIVTLNDTDGLVMKNNSKDVFYLDTNGNVNMIDGYIKLTNDTNSILIDPNVGFKIIKSNNVDAFYVDTDGNVIHDGKQLVTYDGKILIQNWKNARGGVSSIYDNNGMLNVKIGSESGSTDNVGGTFILYSDSPYDDAEKSKPYRRVEAGIDKTHNAGLLILRDMNGKQRVGIYAEDTADSAIIGLFDVDGNAVTYLTETTGKINNETIATQEWVQEHFGYYAPLTPTT